MSVHDAKPGDIYVDNDGKLWRVLWTLAQPSIGVEAIEPRDVDGAKEVLQGGISGIMWEGFKRIYRKDATNA